MDYKTHQIAMINKSLLAQKIRELQGLSSDEKSQLLGLINDHKRYGLVWEDKVEEVEEQLQEHLPILSEVTDKRILSTEGDAPNHILIEGDNLHALTCLSYTHEGKIDVIYIDPPYNTGNKDFVYNDSYVDSEDDFRHSKWLSFMNKRLRIARRLLSDNGVIFISIDDNEQAALKLLCDEVFDAKNYVDTLHWKRKKQPSFLAKHTAKMMEYVLVYAKHWDKLGKLSIETLSDATKKVVNLTNPISSRFFAKGVRVKCGTDGVIPKGKYLIKTMSVEYKNDIYYENGITINDVEVGAQFSVSQDKINDYIKNGLLFITANYGLRRDVSEEEKSKAKAITDLLLDWGDNQDSEKELKEIFNDKIFDYCKPLKLISNIVKSTIDKEVVVLDFFAGSGTTMHAIMQLNNEDGGRRQCILVTNNENGICENVTYERNRRVIQGYTNSKGEQVEGLSNNNLRYYQTNYVPRERTQRNMRALVNAATDLLCIQNNLYEEQDFLIDGKKVSKSIARYFGEMLVVYREEYAEEIARAIEGMEIKGKKLKVYIFSPGRYAFDDTFIDVQDKVELVALPAAIYDAYKHVLPKRREKLFEEPQSSIPTDLFSEL